MDYNSPIGPTQYPEKENDFTGIPKPVDNELQQLMGDLEKKSFVRQVASSLMVQRHIQDKNIAIYELELCWRQAEEMWNARPKDC
jgi:hypothetical protein